MVWDRAAADAVIARNGGQTSLPLGTVRPRAPVARTIPGAPSTLPAPQSPVLAPGEWFIFVVPGDPASKGRPRSVQRKGQQPRMITPKRTEKFEKGFAEHALAVGCPKILGPVELEAVFYTATLRRVDTDNLLKLVTDALNPKWKRDKKTKLRVLSRPGIAYDDDVQIVDLIGRKRYDKNRPRTVLRLRAAVDMPEVLLYEQRAPVALPARPQTNARALGELHVLPVTPAPASALAGDPPPPDPDP